MIMSGLEFIGKIPFDKVYFTGLIRDEQGRKMSKTLGNSPDPLEVMKEFGNRCCSIYRYIFNPCWQ